MISAGLCRRVAFPSTISPANAAASAPSEAKSILGRAAAAGLSGARVRMNSAMTAAAGTFTRNIARQFESESTSPPKTGPIAAPAEIAAPLYPSERPSVLLSRLRRR